MKILIVTPRFYPEQFKINDIAFHLAKSNDVDVICNIPDYHIGKYYKGYGVFKKRKEKYNNTNIYRLFTIQRRHNLFSLGLSYISFLFSGLTKASFLKNKYDVVLNYQLSPVYINFVGLKIAKKFHIPCITYILDYWPDSLCAAKKSIKKDSIFYKTVAKHSNKSYKQSDYIFISSLGFKQKLTSLGINDNKIFYMPNFGEDIFYKNILNEQLNISTPKNKFKILYAGNIGLVQRLDVLINIAMIAKKENDNRFVFIVVGEGSYKEELKANIIKENLENYFIIYDEQPIINMPNFYNDADAFFFSLDKQLAFTTPAKLVTYFAYNKPILAFAYDECKDLINEYGGGVIIDENKPYQSCNYLINNHVVITSKINKSFYKNNFVKNEVLDKLEKTIFSIVKNK